MLTKTILLTVFTSAITIQCRPNNEGSQDWWKTAVFYQIYPRSFMDLNNDGIGDLNGITSRLDHLADAGVTALWLSPIYKSPQVDHGYDISDYRDVDKIFGTLDDFKVLLAAAKSKDLKVILDFVPNHSSDKHEWFGKSERRVPGYENYYVWKDGSPDQPPNNWISSFHGPAWTYSKIRQQWYLHQFTAGQPDLNYREPKLVQEMKDILLYWLDLGVDGFRIDVITHLFEDESFPDEPLSNDTNATPNDHEYLLHIYTKDHPGSYDMCYQWRDLLDKYTAKHGGDARVMMTESYSPEDKLFGYYGNETHNGAHFTFNFWFIMQLNVNSSAQDIKSVIDKWYRLMPEKYVANWVLGNHDRHRVASRYGAPRVDGLNMIVMSLPGVAVTYNGEEFGMENGEVTWEEGEDPKACNGIPMNFDKDSRDFERTPLQWDTSVNAGFNKGAKPWLPVSEKYKQTNLLSQEIDGIKSHYRVYQALIKQRKSLDVLKYGSLKTLALNQSVIAIIRKLEGNSTYVVLVNTRNKNEVVDLSGSVPDSLSVLIPSVKSSRDVGNVLSAKEISLSPYEALVLAGEENLQTIAHFSN